METDLNSTLDTYENSSYVNNTTICSLYSSMHGDNCDVLIYVERVSASLSMIGCIFTLTVLLFYKRYMEYSQRLILHLCLAALLEGVCFYFIGRDSVVQVGNSGKPTAICLVQATWLLYCLWAVLLWTLFIAFNLLLNIVWAKSLKKYEIILSFLCWGIPGIIISIPFFFNEYQTGYNLYAASGPWCWLNDDQIYWKVGLWYIWAFLSFVGLFALIIFKNCKRGMTTAEGALYFSFKWQQPVVIHDIHIIRAHHTIFFFLMLVLFPFVNDIYYAIHHEYVLTLVLLEAVSVPFVGGAITVSFLIDKSTRYVLHPKVIAEILRRRFKIIDELLREERTTSCDTFMIDIFTSSTSGDISSRESTASSHYFERHGNTELLDMIREEISDIRQTEATGMNVIGRNKDTEIARLGNRDSLNTLATERSSNLIDLGQSGSHDILAGHRSRIISKGNKVEGIRFPNTEESSC